MVIFFTIIPVFLIILCGYLCRHFQFPNQDFWRGAEKITYFLFFPALLISKMATANLDRIDFTKPVILVFLLLLIATLLLLMFKPMMRLNNNAAFTSVYQGGIRFNTYIGLAVVFALYGADGLVIAVILASIMIPTINILCVFILEYYGGDGASSQPIKGIIRSVLTNPLIVACAIGMGINVSGIMLPSALLETLNLFARAALPLGLLTVGAALTLGSITSSITPLLVSSCFKFIALPIIAMSLCLLLNIEPMVRDTMLILTILPTATASYVLARQLGGDYELMAIIITGQTLLAGIMIPLILMIATALYAV